eukprot:1676032-Rhodomonas_salina.1
MELQVLHGRGCGAVGSGGPCDLQSLPQPHRQVIVPMLSVGLFGPGMEELLARSFLCVCVDLRERMREEDA